MNAMVCVEVQVHFFLSKFEVTTRYLYILFKNKIDKYLVNAGYT